jgi:protein-tyrosine-phosphatase
MTPAHLEQVKQLGGRGKVHVLDQYASGADSEGISDPFGGELSAYRNTAHALERHLEKVFDRLEI